MIFSDISSHGMSRFYIRYLIKYIQTGGIVNGLDYRNAKSD